MLIDTQQFGYETRARASHLQVPACKRIVVSFNFVFNERLIPYLSTEEAIGTIFEIVERSFFLNSTKPDTSTTRSAPEEHAPDSHQTDNPLPNKEPNKKILYCPCSVLSHQFTYFLSSPI